VAVASPKLQCYPSHDGAGMWCKGEDGGEYFVPQNASKPEGGTGSPGSSTTYVAYDRVVEGADGEPCVTRGHYREGTELPDDADPGEIPSQDRTPGAGGYNNFYETYPPCPPGEGQEPGSPGAWAANYWEHVPLPKPSPYIAPGWAIVGKFGYLETNGTTFHRFTTDSPFGPLQIEATGIYYVDWGDGEASGPHSVEGKPWPHGEIRHDFQYSGTYNIVVTQRWTATWSFGDAAGILRQLQTTAEIAGFEAREIQAVVGG